MRGFFLLLSVVIATASASTTTTAEETTAAPTTAEETTTEQTTAEQTTAEETTAAPTTAEQTTAEETTAAPTTAEETTAAPTTAEETTAAPTTAEETTAAPTTAAPTTAAPTTTVTPEYATQRPFLGSAVYNYKFPIKTNNPSDFNKDFCSNPPSELKKNIVRIFQLKFTSFKGVFPTNNPNCGVSSRKKRDTASGSSAAQNTNVELTAEFSASELTTKTEDQLTDFKNNLSIALDTLNTTLANTSYSFDRDNAPSLDNFVAKLRDACQAVSTSQQPLCSVEYTCLNSSCVHRCQGFSCSQQGVCLVQVLNNVAEAKCRCTSDEVYDYSGDHCESQTLQDRWVGAIAGGVTGLVALVVVVAVIVYCCCRHRRAKHDTSSEQSSEEGYHRHYIVPKYTTEYDNASFQKEGMTDMYIPSSGTTGADPEALSRFYGGARLLPADSPWLEGPVEAFVIQRPTVDRHPRPHSRNWT